MKTFLVLTIVQLISNISSAYILPLDTILNKTCALAGNSIIAVEQDVVFKEYNKEFSIHEEWLIEGDKNLKLTATGNGELKDLVRLTYLYNGERMTQVTGKNRVTTKLSRDFFEKYLAIKSRDSYMTYFSDLGVALRVRLSRAGGAVSFAIGQASTEKSLSPQFWIDQDFFQLRKIRLPTEAEIEFNDYQEFGKVHYPMSKKISWADKVVTIRVTKVTVNKPGVSLQSFYPETLNTPSEILVSGKAALGASIEEFYKRFR